MAPLPPRLLGSSAICRGSEEEERLAEGPAVAGSAAAAINTGRRTGIGGERKKKNEVSNTV